MTGRVVRSFSVTPERNEILVENIEDLSKWVSEKIDAEFLDDAEIKKKIRFHKSKINNLKKLLIQKKPSKDNKEEKKWLQSAKIRVNESPGELTENCRVYNQQFGKRISTTKFQELIE